MYTHINDLDTTRYNFKDTDMVKNGMVQYLTLGKL